MTDRARRAVLLTGSVLARVLLAIPALLGFGSILAPGGAFATAGAVVYAAVVLAALVLLRPVWKCAVVVVVAFGVALAFFLARAPRQDRDWQPDVQVPSEIRREGPDVVTVRHVRDFRWTGADAAEPRRVDRTYDLAQLDSVWFALSYWDGNRAICHTMLSFGFTDGRYLAVSVETRKEVGEEYSAWRGFFRQYELFYVLAEERDPIGVRAAWRDENLYLYRLRAEPEVRRRLLEDILRRAESLRASPEWYGALRTNCTTTLQDHIDAALGRPVRFRIDTVLNGDLDEKAWRSGAIADRRPFPEVRASHRITDAARRAAGRDDFSSAIRAVLPRD